MYIKLSIIPFQALAFSLFNFVFALLSLNIMVILPFLFNTLSSTFKIFPC